jgi:hypothetical protein
VGKIPGGLAISRQGMTKSVNAFLHKKKSGPGFQQPSTLDFAQGGFMTRCFMFSHVVAKAALAVGIGCCGLTAFSQQNYTITKFKVAPNSLVMPSTQTADVTVDISPSAPNNMPVTVQITDQFGYTGGSVTIPEGQSTGGTTIGSENIEVVENGTDLLTASVEGDPGSQPAYDSTFQVIFNTPALEFSSNTLIGGGAPVPVTVALLADPVDSAALVDFIVSGPVSIPEIQVTSGDSAMGHAQGQCVSVATMATITPELNLDGYGFIKGRTVTVTVEPGGSGCGSPKRR